MFRRLTMTEATPAAMPDGEFHRLLAKVFRLHGKTVFGRLAPYGITQGQPRLLHYLLAHDGAIQRDISSDNDLEPATVSNILSVMEKAGLVRRGKDPDDRRITRIYITAKGRKAYDRAEAAFREVEVSCFAGFSAAEKAEFLGNLERLYDRLRAESGTR
jgi:DNA-binding MarR family transcriptional regulator